MNIKESRACVIAGSGGIPLARKLCYAVGELPNQITTAALDISLQVFLLDVVQIMASYVSVIQFVSRAWDAVIEPLVGYLVSCSNWTPIGKLTPWLILSTPFGILFCLLLWFVPHGSMSQGLSVLWLSCYNGPYLSLNMFLGGDHRDRDSATAYTPLCCDDKVRPSYLTSLKMLICHIPYQRLVLGFVFITLAFQMTLGHFALFCSHAAGQGAQFQHLLLVLLLFIPAVITIASVPSNLPVFMIMCVLMGFSGATMLLLPWSMLPDVVDDFAVRHPSCKDLEPMFITCYTFCSKLADSLSVGISTMTLQFVGYRAGACKHGDGVVTALIVLFSPVPIALLLIGMVFFHSYPINERRCLQHQEQLTTIQ
ncbi:sodium-dependent lysophosphatidylcholine symporter 1-B-like [Lycodopsis pacificus]